MKKKPILLASASSLEGIKAQIERRYYGPKELIKISDTEYHIQGCRDGVPYIHENDKVEIKKGRFRHIRPVKT